ncbi:class I SAM-dependent methyltransferase [Thiothrix subterranea]|uniref:Class I SAM-dependent methyltransferase n=1 Tax=Thiothrix subterranea TaxID=2735563 RepID=A0AA51MQE9_9GAMM|nr:class I SAM-dependent methyltransferase [Thiothrix subterranea]MDQ5767134.1 class I SAM-dependent methyltransferase [Thiothrix subterranea]WML88004.1 class I SAM-dependent methyltransferase [Thiothrix subterranea]
MTQQRLYTHGWDDYELLDAGDGKKLERWGKILTIRPEVQAYFKPGKPHSEWHTLAHWEFIEADKHSGVWHPLRDAAPTSWEIGYQRLRFQLELTRFKHLGLFPEQRCNWDFIAEHLPAESRFLNLFAYTGAASCIARQTGAETLHVDSVKPLLTWAHSNMERSKLTDIKWVREDALKFVERELKRGRHYDGIIMDPPAWGLGKKGEKWKLDNKLEALLEGVQGLLTQRGFLILNTYSPTIGLAEITRLAHQYFKPQQCEVRELWMQTSTGKDLYYGNVLRVIKHQYT